MNIPDKQLPETKRAYKKPEILVYGDLRELTQHVGVNAAAKADGPPHAGGLTRTR